MNRFPALTEYIPYRRADQDRQRFRVRNAGEGRQTQDRQRAVVAAVRHRRLVIRAAGHAVCHRRHRLCSHGRCSRRSTHRSEHQPKKGQRQNKATRKRPGFHRRGPCHSGEELDSRSSESDQRMPVLMVLASTGSPASCIAFASHKTEEAHAGICATCWRSSRLQLCTFRQFKAAAVQNPRHNTMRPHRWLSGRHRSRLWPTISMRLPRETPRALCSWGQPTRR